METPGLVHGEGEEDGAPVVLERQVVEEVLFSVWFDARKDDDERGKSVTAIEPKRWQYVLQHKFGTFCLLFFFLLYSAVLPERNHRVGCTRDDSFLIGGHGKGPYL